MSAKLRYVPRPACTALPIFPPSSKLAPKLSKPKLALIGKPAIVLLNLLNNPFAIMLHSFYLQAQHSRSLDNLTHAQRHALGKSFQLPVR